MKIWKNTTTLDGFIDEFEVTEIKKDANIILLGSKAVELEEFLSAKGIFRVGIGRDNVPIKEAEDRDVKVAFPSPETIEEIYEETANFTCNLILKMMYLNIGTLSPWYKYPKEALNKRNLLVIGNGNIGKRVAKKATASIMSRKARRAKLLREI